MHGGAEKNNNTGILVNLTDGGEGVSGLLLSAASRNKISIANTGKVRSSKFKENVSKFLTGREVSTETRLKISNSHKGKTLSDNHREQLRVNHVGNTGQTQSPEARTKIGNSHRGEKSVNYGKPAINRKSVICVCTGQIFDCIKSAVAWLISIGHTKAAAGNISKCCKNKLPKSYGYIWNYVLDSPK